MNPNINAWRLIGSILSVALLLASLCVGVQYGLRTLGAATFGYGLIWGLVWGTVAAFIRIHKDNPLVGWHPPIWLSRNLIGSLIGYAVANLLFLFLAATVLSPRGFLATFPVAIIACILIEIPLVWRLGQSIWQ